MRALAKKLFCSLVVLALVQGSVASSDAEVLEEELEKKDTGNTTLKAPIIAVPSEHWHVSVPYPLYPIPIVYLDQKANLTHRP
jgi:hypothetical protein